MALYQRPATGLDLLDSDPLAQAKNPKRYPQVCIDHGSISVGPVKEISIGPKLFLDGSFDGSKVRTGITDGIAILHAGGEHDCLRPSVNHHLKIGKIS